MGEEGPWGGEHRDSHVGGLDKLGLQLTGEEALVDVVQDLVHQLRHDEGLAGEWMDSTQLGYQEHPPCTPFTPILSVSFRFKVMQVDTFKG